MNRQQSSTHVDFIWLAQLYTTSSCFVPTDCSRTQENERNSCLYCAKSNPNDPSNTDRRLTVEGEETSFPRDERL